MRSVPSLILGFAIMIVSGAAVYFASAWPWKAALFPIVIGVPVFCLATAEVAWELLKPGARGEEVMDFQVATDLPPGVATRRTLEAVGWMLGFLVAIALVSFPIAVPLFVLLYLRLRGREGWLLSLAVTFALWAGFYLVFQRLLNQPFPAGWIQAWLGLA